MIRMGLGFNLLVVNPSTGWLTVYSGLAIIFENEIHKMTINRRYMIDFSFFLSFFFSLLVCWLIEIKLV